VHAGASVLPLRLHDDRKLQAEPFRKARLVQDLEARRRDSVVLQHALGQRLPHAEPEGERWRTGVGDAVEVEDGSDRGLQLGVVVEELDQVEHDVRPTAPEQPLELLEIVLQIDGARPVPSASQRLGDRFVLLLHRSDVDGVVRLELQLLRVDRLQLFVRILAHVVVKNHDGFLARFPRPWLCRRCSLVGRIRPLV
jgi:hypothetical protein